MIDLTHYGRPIALGHQGILAPGRLLWLRALAWLLGFAALILVSFGALGGAMTTLLQGQGAAVQFITPCATAAFALGLYALLVRLVERRAPSELAPRPALPELVAGMSLGLLMFAAVMALLIGGGFYEIAFDGANPAWKAAGAAIKAGVVEELIVRGVILRLLWRGFGPVVAFTGSALLFGAGHLPNSGSDLFAALCVALEAGVMLGAFYALTGRLWVSIGVHIGWNFTQGYLFGTAVSGTSFGVSLASSTPVAGQPVLLTGGAFGPEASLPALLVCGSIGVATLWAAWTNGRFGRPAETTHGRSAEMPATAEA